MSHEGGIRKPGRAEYSSLVNIWVASVRASHYFLSEEDFQAIHAEVGNKYLTAVDLYAFYYPNIVTAELPDVSSGCAAWPGGGALPKNGLCAGFIGRSAISPEAEKRLRRLGLTHVPAIQVDMLFVDPVFHRRGIGRALLDFTRQDHPCMFLDVNEQNSAAAHFYARYGFTVIGRSEMDGQGRPYPLLHLYYQEERLLPAG